MREILYISSVCSEEVLQYIFETAKVKPQLAAQKFHRLLAEGFAQHLDKCKVETLSTIPVIPANHSKRVWRLPKSVSNGLTYSYIPMLNVRGLKNLGVFLYTFLRVFFWSLVNTKNKIVICDLLNVAISMASLMACKITGGKIIAIVTDLPGLMVDATSKGNEVAAPKIPDRLTWFDGYIMLTEQMNKIINPENKPYMIMEGLVDINMGTTSNKLENKYDKKVVLYAGGLFEKYGVKKLIDAFKLLEDSSYELHLYGLGAMVDQMSDYIGSDSRIKYLGVVPNQKVVAEQLKVSLLVNPRPTEEEFTKYSFPSKNVEYMVSATPIITTELPGMPMEYHDFVYLFEDESVEGMHKALRAVLANEPRELHRFGEAAKAFVMTKKNNKIQSGRVLEFIDEDF